MESGYNYVVSFIQDLPPDQSPKEKSQSNSGGTKKYKENFPLDVAAARTSQPRGLNPSKPGQVNKVASAPLTPVAPAAQPQSQYPSDLGHANEAQDDEVAKKRYDRGETDASLAVDDNTWATSAKVLREESEHVASMIFKSVGLEGLDPVFQKWSSWWTNLEEPDREGKLAHFVCSGWFEAGCFVVILTNAAFIIAATNYSMEHIGEPLPLWLKLTELWFYLCYLGEFLMRFAVHRMYFFCNHEMAWNTFDFIVILLVSVDIAISFQDVSSATNTAYIRLIRLFRIVKILRAVRGLRQISEVKVVLDMVVQSFMSLIRCIMLLFFILSGFSIFFVQSASSYLETLPEDERHSSEVYQMFRSVNWALISLFEAVSGGIDWANQYAVMGLLGSEAQSVYIFFILFFTIAFWNILTGHFIDSTLKMATTDWEELMLEKRKKDHNDAHRLMKVVRREEGGETDSLTIDDFKRLMRHDEVRSYFESRGIEISDGELLFRMLTGGSGNTLDLNTFIWGCMRLKGMATSIDLHSLDFEVRLMHRNQQEILNECLRNMDRILSCVEPSSGLQTAQAVDHYKDTGLTPRNSSREWEI
jgi:hypothetical protein